MKLTGKRVRDLERALHVGVGVLLLVLVFTPLGQGEAGGILRLGLAPLLGLTGVLMWQHARVARLVRGENRAPARHA